LDFSLNLIIAVIISCCLGCSSLAPKEHTPAKIPLIIGHRGACGYRPEHTLASYELAIDMGADFIEPDLVVTQDGFLIARHENEISTTSDVATKFPLRKKTKLVDGKKIEGWFTEDLTLSEIKSLKAKERLEFRSNQYNYIYDIPTFEEIIILVKRKEVELKRTIGIYPELKHSTYFAALGLPLEDRFVEVLRRYGYTKSSDPIIVQSFEVSNLKYLHKLTEVRLMQLLDEPQEQPYDFVVKGDSKTYLDLTKPNELKNIASYASVIGPYKRFIVPVDKDNQTMPPTDLIKQAHDVGLLVHAYTFRNEKKYLAKDYDDNPLLEYKAFFELGIDGVFTDFPDTAVKAKSACLMQ
jgi:glycerophosphoryl diester phosphodiesterase